MIPYLVLPYLDIEATSELKSHISLFLLDPCSHIIPYFYLNQFLDNSMLFHYCSLINSFPLKNIKKFYFFIDKIKMND